MNEIEGGRPGLIIGMADTVIEVDGVTIGKSRNYSVTEVTDEALVLEENKDGDAIVIGWGLIDAIRRGLTAREDVERIKTDGFLLPEPYTHSLNEHRQCLKCGLMPPNVYNTDCKGTP